MLGIEHKGARIKGGRSVRKLLKKIQEEMTTEHHFTAGDVLLEEETEP